MHAVNIIALSRPLLFAVLLLGIAALAQAHQSESTDRYVDAGRGVDQGDCSNPDQPCKTILYAVRQSQKGDQVRVAAGSYQVDPQDTASLISDMIPVLGGYSMAEGFTARQPQEQPTYISGPSFEHRERLIERGLILLQDPKGLAIERSIQEGLPEVTAPAEPTLCENGRAGPYACRNIDFLGRIALDQFSSQPTSANDIWGFVDKNDGHEYAVIGLRNGTAVVDVTDPAAPREVGTIPGRTSTWRDIKVHQFHDVEAMRWKAYAYVTSEDAVAATFQPEAIAQGLQVIDLTALPERVSLAATYTGFRTAHNVYLGNVDYATGVALDGLKPYVYILGSNRSDGGARRGAYRILDPTDPLALVEVTAPPVDTQYVHDATSLVIDDERANQCAAGHNPCELYVDYNEDSVDLWDVTDKAAPVRISSTTYDGSRYTHSGWWTEDKRHVFIQDELDEVRNGHNTRLYTLDLGDLRHPVLSHTWTGPTGAIDHNGFVKGDRYYMSNYRRGLTVLDIADPDDPQEIGFFDTFPTPPDDARFNGAWGTYPYLPSGTILVSDIEGGLFLLELREVESQARNNAAVRLASSGPPRRPAVKRHW